jgi:SAM-dependent methyltransferase
VARAHPAQFGIDSEKPSTARIYDYYLGGKDNYLVDREAAERVMAVVPESTAAVQSNRAFLIRAVRFLAAEAGIRQFLDVGSGLPTQLNVHEVAHSVTPDAHVVYVDCDPSVRAYGDALLSTAESVRFAQQDLRRPEEILDDPAVHALIDFTQPVAILLVAILPYIDDPDDPEEIVAKLRQVMAPGSYLAISHILDGPRTQAIANTQRYARTHAWTPRSRDRIAGFFGGFELVEPGLTVAAQWRQEPSADAEAGSTPAGYGLDCDEQPVDLEQISWLLAGIGRKP